MSKRSGSTYTSASWLAAAVLHMTKVPAGITTPCELDVLRRHPHRTENHRAEAHYLFDRLHRQLRALARAVPTVRDSRRTRPPRRPPGCGWCPCPPSGCPPRASAARSIDNRSPSSSARISLRNQVVGERFAPAGDHVVDVVVEFPPRREDVGLVFGDVPAEQLEEVVGPVGEQSPVLTRGTEQRGDDRHRVGPGDVGDHLAASLRRRADRSAPLITSTMMSSSRVTDRGVNAFDTSRRSRVWSSPFMASREVLARCHSGPEVMPCVSRPSPAAPWNRGSRSVARTNS